MRVAVGVRAGLRSAGWPGGPPRSRTAGWPGRRPGRRRTSPAPARRGPAAAGPSPAAPAPPPGRRPAGSGPAAGRARRTGGWRSRWISRVTSVASGRVRERVIVVKSANRTVSVTVRPATPATRIRLVTLVVSRSSSRRITSRSSVSRPKVSWAPIDLSGSSRRGPRRCAWRSSRRSVPQASSCSWRPSAWPDRALEGAQRGVGDVADGDQAEPVQQRARSSPPPPTARPRRAGAGTWSPRPAAPPPRRRAWPAGWPAWPPRPRPRPRPSR